VPVQLVTGPTDEPISLAEAKSHLRLDVAFDDVDVNRYIKAAREYVEGYLERAVLEQKWCLALEGFCGPRALGVPAWARQFFDMSEPLKLPMGQLASTPTPVESIIYIDDSGASVTLATSEYTVNNFSVPAEVKPAYGKVWPSTRPQWDAVRVTYRVGWADTDSVPEPIRQAMKLLISQMYEHRTPEVAGILSQVQFSLNALLEPHRLTVPG
jgi:hypothetical protein